MLSLQTNTRTVQSSAPGLECVDNPSAFVPRLALLVAFAPRVDGCAADQARGLPAHSVPALAIRPEYCPACRLIARTNPPPASHVFCWPALPAAGDLSSRGAAASAFDRLASIVPLAERDKTPRFVHRLSGRACQYQTTPGNRHSLRRLRCSWRR